MLPVSLDINAESGRSLHVTLYQDIINIYQVFIYIRSFVVEIPTCVTLVSEVGFYNNKDTRKERWIQQELRPSKRK